MDCLWVIGDSKKGALKKKKSAFWFFLLSYFCTLFFAKNGLFATFFESLITHKRFIFEESYIFYNKRQELYFNCYFSVKCLYLTSPIFNSPAKSNRIFFWQRRKYNVIIVAIYCLNFWMNTMVYSIVTTHIFATMTLIWKWQSWQWWWRTKMARDCQCLLFHEVVESKVSGWQRIW